jgi:hypothetical protein
LPAHKNTALPSNALAVTAIHGIRENKGHDGQDVYEAKLCMMGAGKLTYVTDDGEE